MRFVSYKLHMFVVRILWRGGKFLLVLRPFGKTPKGLAKTKRCVSKFKVRTVPS